MKITVQCKPGMMLRKPGPKRLRLVDGDDAIRAGLHGKAPTTAQRSPADYFTDVPEQVEFTPWIERMVRRGALQAVPASKPMHITSAAADKPVPLTE